VSLKAICENNHIKPKAVIFDIDGTLANIDHRRHLLNLEKKHWSLFFDSMIKDKPNEWCKKMSNLYHSQGYTILLVSGRPDNYMSVTRGWLEEHDIRFHWLFLRKENDYRPDFEIKKEIYEKYIDGKYGVEFVVDDRSQVVKLWRELGLVCLQCAEGDY